MLLFYDSKCSICRTLAYKIHFLTEKNVEIQSLYSSEAEEALSRHYPNGWEHDFYIVHNGTCRKGLRALPSLMRSLGLKRMASLVAEYGSYKLSPKTCNHANGNGVVQPKRNFLKLAAMTPLIYGFSRVRLDNPLEGETPLQGFGVHVAEVEKVGGELRARAYLCTDCQRTPVEEKGLPPGAAKRLLDRTVIAQDSINGYAAKAQGLANFKVERIEYERDLPRNGVLVTERRLIHSAMLDHPRYNLSVNVSETGERMLAGMARHDLPIPTLDYVIFRPDVEEDAATHLAAYQVGLRELAKLHRKAGRQALARVYAEMAEGFAELTKRFDGAQGLWPLENEIVVTSMPELMRFVQRPEHLQKVDKAAGCNCSCSCATCCGCGCSIGICVEPFSPCGCDCCVSCGCGCGCCL
ncbi:MAG TPA: hypothetical protein VJ725_20260 [Thermoanaerobaculia bacterium]|nr:hypothetical protein [Thermoanaerobaculia bacterium]